MANQNPIYRALKKHLPARYKTVGLMFSYLPMFEDGVKRTIFSTHHFIERAVRDAYVKLKLESNLSISEIEKIVVDEVAQHFWTTELYQQFKNLEKSTHLTEEEFWAEHRQFYDSLGIYLTQQNYRVSVHRIREAIFLIVEQVFKLHTDYKSKI